MKIQDNEIMYVITGFIIISFIIFTAGLKSYMKNNEDVILNMKDTEKGKKERRKYIIKNILHQYSIGLF